MSEAQDLQEEILEKIFSYSPSDERQILRRVCRSWEGVINDAFGIKVIINNANDDLMYSSPWVIDVEFNSMTKSLVGEIAFGTRVRTCTFRNMVVFYNLIPILQACPNLKSLCFRDAIVDLPESSIVFPVNRILLPFLQRLELHSWSFNESLMTIFSFFIKVDFGQLKEILVPSGYSPVLPINWIFHPSPDAIVNPEIHALIRLVAKNIHSIEQFKFGTVNSPVKMNFHPFELFGSVQLKEVEISLFHEGWTIIFQNQIHLRALHISNCRVEQWGELRETIIRNAATLKNVGLRGRTFNIPWDCTVFQTTSLVELTLNICMSPKTGLQFLPTSLIKLDIDGPITLAELTHILDLINLEELSFKGLGVNLINIVPETDVEEKIQLSLFRSFLVKLPLIKFLSFYECSSNALDWDTICDWCDRISALHGITFRQFYYDMHGQLFRHGVRLVFPSDIVISRNIFEDPVISEDVEENIVGLSFNLCELCKSASTFLSE